MGSVEAVHHSFSKYFGNLDDRQFSWTFALPDTNSSHLKMDNWETILSFWGPAYFQGRLLLVSGG